MKGRWRGPTPERPFPSLGWLFLDWSYAYLPNPSDDIKPLIYTDEQARRIVKWFQLHPITGEFVYTTLILEEAKGWGKGPFAATLDIGDFVGPVCFDGWDANGEPVGVPPGTGGRRSPFIQDAALSEGQTDNSYGYVYSMLAARGGKVADDLGIDVGRTRLYLPHDPGAVLEPVTASAGSRTGQPITKATMDETWLATRQTGGTKLASTLRFNLSKTDGRMVETTNAPVLGLRSVAEQADPDHPINGVLHYATRPRIKPDPSMTDEELEQLLVEIYKDVPWINPRRLVRDIRDPRTAWDDVVRQFFNLRSPGAGRAVEPRRWDDLARDGRDATHPLVEIPTGTRVGAGFDGSISRDATVLSICTAAGFSKELAAWERPTGDALVQWLNAHPGATEWTVDRLAVKQAVAEMFATYDVGLMLCDTPKWRTEIEEWAELYKLGDKPEEQRVLAFDTAQARRFAPAVDRWLTGIREGSHTHSGAELTSRHVKAAHLQRVRLDDDEDDGRTLYVLIKGDDHAQIDGAITDVLAFEAAMTMPERGPASVYETRGFHVLRSRATCPDCRRETLARRRDQPGWRCQVREGGCGQIFELDDERVAAEAT